MKEVITVVLGGGRGTRPYRLTKHRAKPAMPLGGKYRLIDNSISNCINDEERAPSGLPSIGIGDDSAIEGAIVDKLARIGRNTQVADAANIDHSGDGEECVIRDGIPVVLKNAVFPDAWRLS